MPRSPLKLRELLKRLSNYGVIVMSDRGKGSEMILLLPEQENSKKGPIYPIKNHGLGKEVSVPVINAVLRRFNIDNKEFWDK